MSTHIKGRLYLKLGADPNMIPEVLGKAIASEDSELVKILIDNGAIYSSKKAMN